MFSDDNIRKRRNNWCAKSVPFSDIYTLLVLIGGKFRILRGGPFHSRGDEQEAVFKL